MDKRKAAMRRSARAARRSIAPDARRAAAEVAASRVLELPQLAGIRSVLVYAAMPEEIDPAPIADALRAAGVRTAYPRVEGPGEITMHWGDGEDLEPGHYGILEPPADSALADASDIDAVIVPGAAFDGACRRLGLGGGFYDRLLRRLRPETVKVGLAFDEQVVDAVPTADHDVPLDFVVTPTRTLRPVR